MIELSPVPIQAQFKTITSDQSCPSCHPLRLPRDQRLSKTEVVSNQNIVNIDIPLKMKSILLTVALSTPGHALIRFPCSQLVVDRLDPLVTPGQVPSPHLHQIAGGVSNFEMTLNAEFDCLPYSLQNAFNGSMYPEDIDPPADSTCTTCQYSEDFSNYWTAVLYVMELGSICQCLSLTEKQILQSPQWHV